MQKTKEKVVVVVEGDKTKGLFAEVGSLALETGKLGRHKYGRTNQFLEKAGGGSLCKLF